MNDHDELRGQIERAYEQGDNCVDADLAERVLDRLEKLERASLLGQLIVGGLRPGAEDVDAVTEERIEEFTRLTNDLQPYRTLDLSGATGA
jgi:hypothetical protein